MNQPASLGRIVHAVIQDKLGRLVVRPAIIVQVWGPTTVNLQVFLDGSGGPESEWNDGRGANCLWVKSAVYDPIPSRANTWHWPPTVSPRARPAGCGFRPPHRSVNA